MKNLTLENIAGACAGKLILPDNWEAEKGGREASCVVIDSRKIEPEGIFIATRGEKVDGHSFIPAVEKAGAMGIVCEKQPEKEEIEKEQEKTSNCSCHTNKRKSSHALRKGYNDSDRKSRI